MNFYLYLQHCGVEAGRRGLAGKGKRAPLKKERCVCTRLMHMNKVWPLYYFVLFPLN